MEISIFKKPKNISIDAWVDTVAEVIIKTYYFDSAERRLVKSILTKSIKNDNLSFANYAKAIEEAEDNCTDDDEAANLKHIEESTCPMYVRKRDWISLFDSNDENAKSIDLISSKGLASAIKMSCDKSFTMFFENLWLRVNVPSAYARFLA